MRYLVLIVITTTAAVALFGIPVISSISCIKLCDGNRNIIACNQSRILISDVTNTIMEKNHITYFENIKRRCMGKGLCDLSSTCNVPVPQLLLVHYLCVDASTILSSTCSASGIKMNKTSGYIQSPGYPAGTSKDTRCRWEIEPPSGSAVVVSLHDVVIKNSQEKCEDVLALSGQSCTGKTHVSHLCGGDNITSLTLCGKVNIELQSSHRQFEMRFWLSFRALRKELVSTFQNPAVHCSSLNTGLHQDSKNVETGTMTTESATMMGVNQDSNTEVLVIMLSIISGISAVLLVILIIVCVRCRLLQALHEEHAYSDRTPSVQAHCEYTSSSEMEKIRPQLAEGYFQVADALPFFQRVEEPNSPPYVEVEQFSQLRKVLRLSFSGEGSTGSKTLNDEKPYDYEPKNAKDKQVDKACGISESSQHKSRVLNRLKGERSKQGSKGKKGENNKSSNDSKIIPAYLNTEAIKNPALSYSQANSEDERCPQYETIDKYSEVKSCSNTSNKPHISTKSSPSEKLPANILLKNSSARENDTKSFEKVKDDLSLYSEISSDTQHIPHFNTTLAVMKKTKKTDNFSKDASSYWSERSKTLPSKNSKASLQTLEAKNIGCRHKAFRDMPQASGIVKNGIKKFEQNSA